MTVKTVGLMLAAVALLAAAASALAAVRAQSLNVQSHPLILLAPVQSEHIQMQLVPCGPVAACPQPGWMVIEAKATRPSSALEFRAADANPWRWQRTIP
jgi:hypothetical protein